MSHPDFPRTKIGLAQIKAFNNGKANTLARSFVKAKIRNQLNLMKYFHKYHGKVNPDFHTRFCEEENRISRYAVTLSELSGEESIETLRGKLLAIEGNTASSYWALVRELIKERVEFNNRVHRGASDLFNSMLNYGYGILLLKDMGCCSACRLESYHQFSSCRWPGQG